MVTVLIKPTFPNVINIFTKVIMVMFIMFMFIMLMFMFIMFMFIFDKVMMVRGPRVFHIGEW